MDDIRLHALQAIYQLADYMQQSVAFFPPPWQKMLVVCCRDLKEKAFSFLDDPTTASRPVALAAAGKTFSQNIKSAETALTPGSMPEGGGKILQRLATGKALLLDAANLKLSDAQYAQLTAGHDSVRDLIDSMQPPSIQK